MNSLAELIASSKVMVCTGSGGVGKTTVAAAIALGAAREGRSAVVVTIDPAKRLADALGLDRLDNEPAQVDGNYSGELWAMMLDTKTTFDDLVRANALSEEQAQVILDNTFYRNISGALSGTQEFMAAEKLHDLADDDRFDLIVIDTPPSRNALDFVEAPDTLIRFLDHPLYRVLTSPTRGIAKALSLAAQVFLRTISRLVGAAVIDDVITFFEAFEGLDEGFKERANAVSDTLRSDETAYVLVASAKSETITEAKWFADKLASTDIEIAALVVNRLHPRPEMDLTELREGADTHSGTALGDYYQAAADLVSIAEREATHLEHLRAEIAKPGEEPLMVRVPMLESDVHDLDGVSAMGTFLIGE